MFEFVRVNAGERIETQLTDLNQLTRETCDTLRTSAAAKQIAFHLELNEPLPLVQVNRSQFARVILNLVENDQFLG